MKPPPLTAAAGGAGGGATRCLWAVGLGCALLFVPGAAVAAAQEGTGGHAGAPVTTIIGGNGTWINWEGTVSCHPQTLLTPTSVEEIARAVAYHRRVRVAGAGHSFNDFVCSRDLMLSTRGLNQVGGVSWVIWGVWALFSALGLTDPPVVWGSSPPHATGAGRRRTDDDSHDAGWRKDAGPHDVAGGSVRWRV